MGEEKRWERFELDKRLDSPAPGQNFAIGRGLGVAVVLEKTSPGELEIAPTCRLQLWIDAVELKFTSRTVDEAVTV
jgi:hypothetical protein